MSEIELAILNWRIAANKRWIEHYSKDQSPSAYLKMQSKVADLKACEVIVSNQ